MSETKPGIIFQLIPKIMGEIPEIGKTRKNLQQGYAFRGVDEVMAAFQPALARNGVFYVPEVLSRETVERQSKNGGLLIYTTLHVAFTFYATDGSSVTASTVGEAMDSADKSSNKAMSAALKYALVQVFCVPTVSMEDADETTHDVAPKSTKPQTAPKAPTKPEPVKTAPPVTKADVSERIANGIKQLGLTDQWMTDWAASELGTVDPWQKLDEECKRKCLRRLKVYADEKAVADEKAA